MAILLVSLFLCVQSFALSGNGPGERSSSPMVKGSVLDAVSRKPIGGVRVTVLGAAYNNGLSFVTDAQGNFAIPHLPEGEVTILLEKKGYKTQRREKILIREGVSISLQIDFTHERAATGMRLFHPLLRMLEG